jgi:hypothetical protein
VGITAQNFEQPIADFLLVIIVHDMNN